VQQLLLVGMDLDTKPAALYLDEERLNELVA
jgi:hypothetical protein